MTGREVGPTFAREGGPVRYRARVEYDGTEFDGFQAQLAGEPSKESWRQPSRVSLTGAECAWWPPAGPTPGCMRRGK